MAAVSAPHAPSSLTPPSSSHGRESSWNYSSSSQTEASSQSKMSEHPDRLPTHINGNSLDHPISRPDLSQKRTDTTRSNESAYLAPARINALTRQDSSISETGSAPDSLLDLYGPNRSAINSVDLGEMKNDVYDEEDPEHSRWIHRDKLARIESQELQAAGIILPRSRAASKSSRREHSRDQQGNGLRSEQGGQKRQRIESLPAEEEEGQENANWDLRLPEEAAEDHAELFQDVSGGIKGVSRIPVAKTSPIPIPIQHLERDTPMRRKPSGVWGGEDDQISYSKTRGRSASVKLDDGAATLTPAKRLGSDSSPTKRTVRKGSTATSRAPSAQRPKPRSASNRDPPTRPSTRSGELNTTAKRPEGDPPWLASMYKPDPRLPPDQQLLPTIAKRLQQEQWEKEGKFGNVYDTSFRPLNDNELPPPETAPEKEKVDTPEQKPEEDSPEWPLRGPKSPTLSTGRPGTAGGYSTMPKITTAPQEPVPSPVVPVRVQEPPEDTKKGGCGCCVVM